VSFTRFRALGAALLAVPAGACVAPGPVNEAPAYAPCRTLGSSDWKAEVRVALSAHPKPLKRRRLVVTGKVIVPEGHGADLVLGPVAQLDPPVQQIVVRTHGSGSADAPPTTVSVQGDFPAPKRFGAVAIRCGDGIIAEIEEISGPAPKPD
jgi:hypothetical protein